MNTSRKKIAAFFVAVFSIAALGGLPGCKPKKAEEGIRLSTLARVPDIKERLAKYSPTDIVFDEALLDEENRHLLDKFIAAARHMDDIFWKQAYPEGPVLREALEKSNEPWAPDFLRFFKINFGPFDRQDENRPFLGSASKTLGAGFYPADLTQPEFEDYVASHPEVKESFLSPYTVIKREGYGLIAVPYNIEYAEDIEPAAQALREAAAIASNPLLKSYLLQRADDLMANDYYKSDCLWIELKDTLAELVIGPFEVYEDGFMGIKAAYESFVYINDRAEMEKLKGYLSFLEEMQRRLPVEPKYKDQEVGSLESPLNVVIEVFTSGDTKSGIQTSAFVLPNDEKVREEKGTKKVFLKNVMEAKFQKSLVRISRRVLSEEDAALVSFDAYFNEVVLHEICHALGPSYVTLADGSRITINQALKEHNSTLEEAKADVVGLHNVPLLMERGWIPREKEREIYTTYLAGMFRSLRFGAASAHGLGTISQLNYLREKGAFLYDPETERFRVNFDTVKPAVRALAAELLTIQGEGNYDKAGQFLAKYGIQDEVIQKMIAKLTDIPVDIEPIFKF
ncbi:MAG: peptidase [Candidatus Aminicenantes bacterium]|nr:peptidase [Candidatus Aminicenantes bacterium]